MNINEGKRFTCVKNYKLSHHTKIHFLMYFFYFSTQRRNKLQRGEFSFMTSLDIYCKVSFPDFYIFVQNLASAASCQ